VILSREGGALRLVRQVEHGRLAGELAAAWGNDAFELGGGRSAVVTAAARHDEGWRAEDARVLYAEAARRPLHFLEIDTADHVRLYRRGVETVAALDVYAGLLVGMHWTGLYRGRWSAPGAAGRLARTERDRRLQDEVVRAEEQRWIDARRQAWDDDEPRSVFETRLWHHFDLLQLWDLLSLYLAVSPREPGAPGPAERWGRNCATSSTGRATCCCRRWPGGPAVRASRSPPRSPHPAGSPSTRSRWPGPPGWTWRSPCCRTAGGAATRWPSGCAPRRRPS
jgi:hypothetical protein